MKAIARRRYGFASLAVVIGITLSVLLLAGACGGSNGRSDHLVGAGDSSAATAQGSGTGGPVSPESRSGRERGCLRPARGRIPASDRSS